MKELNLSEVTFYILRKGKVREKGKGLILSENYGQWNQYKKLLLS